jgi:hypothetical protein
VHASARSEAQDALARVLPALERYSRCRRMSDRPGGHATDARDCGAAAGSIRCSAAWHDGGVETAPPARFRPDPAGQRPPARVLAVRLGAIGDLVNALVFAVALK